MSITTLPTLKVGGVVTQEVIKHIPQPPSKSTLKKQTRNHSGQGVSPNGPQGRQTLSGYSKDFSSTPETAKEKPDAFIDTARYRNSYKHNLCLDMLQDGFHKAFCELFELLNRQKEILSQEQFDASEVNVVLLEDEPEKLDTLKENLIAAESARRRGRSDHVYQSQLTLAEYFSAKADGWLSDYFYYQCLETSLQIRGDGRRKEAEANYNLGVTAEKRTDFMQAVHFTETSYNISKGKDWEDETGMKLHQKGCEALQRMYTSIAEQIEEEDVDQAIDYLQKALEMAQEAGNQKKIGEAEFRLGRACEDYGDSDSAIKYFADYLEICNVLRDDIGKAKACQALANAHHSQGDVNNAIEYLTMYLDIAKRSGQKEAEGAACSQLAALHNSLGQYTSATDYCSQAFKTSKETNTLDVIEEFRTASGVVSANAVFENLARFIVSNERPAVKQIMSWRDSRADIKVEQETENLTSRPEGNDA
eukprot:gene833-10575_t